MKQVSSEELIMTTNNDYEQIINLKRTAFKDRKNIRYGKNVLIVLAVISVPGWLLGLSLLGLLVSAILLSTIYFFERQPILITGFYFCLYVVNLLYDFYKTLSTTGFKPTSLITFIFSGVILYFLTKAFFSALNYKKSVNQLEDLNIDISRV